MEVRALLSAILVKSDYLCLRYGNKRTIFKADADVAIVVAGHLFKLWPVTAAAAATAAYTAVYL